METLIVISLGLAFYWLMVETNWLRIRLPRHCKMMDLMGLIFVAIGVIIAVFLDGSDEQHEITMKSIWKVYGRKQPPIISARPDQR